MNQANYHDLFGPVPSRRFGRSLGIDLTPHKTCCFDCVFCQLGRTHSKTIARDEYLPMDAALSELDRWLRSGGEADYMTLSGAGEPTLHSRFGEVLDFIRFPFINGPFPQFRRQSAESLVRRTRVSFRAIH